MRALLLAFLLTCAAPAAQADDTRTPDTRTLLARVYVSESGWESRRDHAAIYHAVANGAERRGVTFRAQLIAYSRGLSGRSARARWVRGLRADLRPGDGWPAAYPWPRFRPLWARVLAAAGTDVVFPPDNPCDGPPRHWGGLAIRADRTRAARALRAGWWRRLDCGPTRNAFYAVR